VLYILENKNLSKTSEMEEEDDPVYKILNDAEADYDDLYELADKLDVCMDGLNEIPEMIERIKMHLDKNAYGNPKTLVSVFMQND